MKERTITKPVLNTSQALAFATGSDKKENIGDSIGKAKKTAKKANMKADNARVFFAPEGDKRLTININAELHKKLKISAIEQGITAGEIIEQLIEKHL